jgi:hypothetical protein
VVNAKKIKSYTVRGIRSGAHDDDLDRLRRAITSRRVSLGQVAVVSPSGGVKKKKRLVPDAEIRTDDVSTSDGQATPAKHTYRKHWAYGESKLMAEKEGFIPYVNENGKSPQAPLHGYYTPTASAISLDTSQGKRYFEKRHLQNRIMFVDPTHWSTTGVIAVYAVGTGRRNIKGYVLDTDYYGARRKTSLRNAASSNTLMDFKPEVFLDFEVPDPVQKLRQDGYSVI